MSNPKTSTFTIMDTKSGYETNSRVSPQPITQSGQTQIFKKEDAEDNFKTKNKKDIPASLLVLNGPRSTVGLFYKLEKPIIKVGRSNSNDISILSRKMSKNHFQILKEKGFFYLVDLKSTNKTYIDETEVTPYQKNRLKDHSYLRAGDVIFKFLDKGNIELLSAMKMIKKTYTDSLTGAGNQRLLKAKGNHWFMHKKDMSLIVFDIDNFKSINDTFGHLAGNFVLKSLSAHVSKIIRGEDMFIRYGGDEFCVLSAHPLSSALKVAHRIEDTISSSDFVFKEKRISVSISVGTAERTLSDKTWKDIYQRADKASYEIKQAKKKKQQDAS